MPRRTGSTVHFARANATYTRPRLTCPRRIANSFVAPTTWKTSFARSTTAARPGWSSAIRKALGFRLAHYLVVTLPEDERDQEKVIADAHSFVRRDAVVYQGVTSVEVEEIVRDSTLVGETRVLVDLPAEAR